MLGVLGVLEVLNWRFGHEPTPRAGKVGLYRGTRTTAIKADVGRAVGSRGRRQRSQPSRYLTTSRVCDLNSGKVGNTLGGGAVSVSAMAGISRETKSHRTGLAASLFGVTSISDVLARVEHAVKGRLLVFFSGRSRDGR